MSDETDDRLMRQRAKLQAMRDHSPREAEPHQASDPIGVSAHPGPAENRNEPTRESYDPDADIFTRRSRDQRSVGMLEIPKHRQRPGWTYQWVAIRVLGEPADPSRIRDFTYNGGWRPVPARDIPELVDEGAPALGPIEAEGCRLYTRPFTLTRQAQIEDLEYAAAQQRDRTMAAAGGNSAIRGEDGIPVGRGIRRMPVQFDIENLAG